MKKGETVEVINDCYCEGYLHEKRNYPRPGLEEKKLKQGDKVKVVEYWFNFYGEFIRVVKDEIIYDVKPENLK